MSTVFVFQNTSLVFLTEKILEENGVKYDIVPTPKIDIVSCGVCIKVSKDDRDKVKRILDENNIEVAKIHDVT